MILLLGSSANQTESSGQNCHLRGTSHHKLPWEVARKD